MAGRAALWGVFPGLLLLYQDDLDQSHKCCRGSTLCIRVAWFSKSAQKRLQTILVIPMGTNSWNLEEERARSNARLAKRVRSFTIRASIGNWCGLDFSRIWRVYSWKYGCKSNKTSIWTYINEKKFWKPEYLIPRLPIWKILFTTVI